MFGFTQPNIPSVEVEVVKHAIDTNEPCVILDVRTPGEYSRGKLKGSINLSVEQVVSQIQSIIPDTSMKIYVYCLSGARSSEAVERMIKLGYTNVWSMSKGLLGWRAKHFPMQ